MSIRRKTQTKVEKNIRQDIRISILQAFKSNVYRDSLHAWYVVNVSVHGRFNNIMSILF